MGGGGAGINEDTRSGLWSEYARLVGEIRPKFIIVENVSALLGRGLDRVLRDLAQIGYDAEWHCIPASAVGAPHRRDRIWIVAYPGSTGLERQWNISSRIEQELRDACDNRGWLPEPNVGRVANGVPSRSHRLKCLGNAVIPQIPEIIGRAIMSVHNQGEHP